MNPADTPDAVEIQAKALKLLEAMTEPHETPADQVDHDWRKCRTCLAQVESTTERGRILLAALRDDRVQEAYIKTLTAEVRLREKAEADNAVPIGHLVALVGKVRSVSDNCTWTEDGDGAWHTACGGAFQFVTDGPWENQFRFCSYCGKRIKATR